MYKQIIIARKDLRMSAGKLAAQVSHASMAFLINDIRNNVLPLPRYRTFEACRKKLVNGMWVLAPLPAHWYMNEDLNRLAQEAYLEGKREFCAVTETTDGKNWYYRRVDQELDAYQADFVIEKDLYEDWINGIFTKVVLQAKNRNQLMKAVEMAQELGWKEGIDYFLIKDNCRTELEPEEVDENGVGRTLTCIGFRPMDAETIDKIGKKFHVFEGEVI